MGPWYISGTQKEGMDSAFVYNVFLNISQGCCAGGGKVVEHTFVRFV